MTEYTFMSVHMWHVCMNVCFPYSNMYVYMCFGTSLTVYMHACNHVNSSIQCLGMTECAGKACPTICAYRLYELCRCPEVYKCLYKKGHDGESHFLPVNLWESFHHTCGLRSIWDDTPM